MSKPASKATVIGRCFLIALTATPFLLSAAGALRFQTLRAAVSNLFAALLAAMLIAALARTWRRFFVAFFPPLILATVFAGYQMTFGVPPGRTAALLLGGVSLEEAHGLLSIPMIRNSIGLLILASIFYLVLALRQPAQAICPTASLPESGRRWRGCRALLLLCIPLTIYCATNSADLVDGLGSNPVLGSALFLGDELPRARRDLAGGMVHKLPYRASRSGGEEVHILVIGESARRASWSAYGYSRATTPHLASMRNEIIFLQNALADANLTAWSVPILLTGLTPEQLPHSEFHGNLLDLAREAGYDTSWLINHDITISNFVGVNADHMTYPPEISRSLYGRDTLDEILLPSFRAALARAGKPRFIGLHMMGSHWIYTHRYPASFHLFGPTSSVNEVTLLDPRGEAGKQQLVNAYDNTLAYTDWILNALIEQARTLRVPATLTYFPDHGEDLELLDGTAGHGSPAFTPHDFEIPAFVWMNDAYRQAHPDKVAALTENAAKLIRTHDVFTTVADLMGINWPARSPSRSFVSRQFQPDTAMKYIAGGRPVDRLPPVPRAQDLSARR